MVLFSLITLTPVGLIALAALFGGIWPLAALLYITTLSAVLDQYVKITVPNAPEGAEFPTANILSVALTLAHFALLGLTTYALSHTGTLGLAEKMLLFIATGLFLGQISNSNAHELIHRSNRALFTLGKWAYIGLLFGHHTSSHTRVHHRHVATTKDPNTSRRGESFYRFLPRAWIGSFRAGMKAETDLRARKFGAKGRHPYVDYVVGAIIFCTISVLIGGIEGLIAYICLCSFAQTQLLLSDYVQHYGLFRTLAPTGAAVPVAPHHSWNSPHWFTSSMMLNAPRHSDHHTHPSRPYPALSLPSADEAPMLPRSLPVMACIALYPRLWRRVMDPRVDHWAARE